MWLATSTIRRWQGCRRTATCSTWSTRRAGTTFLLGSWSRRSGRSWRPSGLPESSSRVADGRAGTPALPSQRLPHQRAQFCFVADSRLKIADDARGAGLARSLRLVLRRRLVEHPPEQREVFAVEHACFGCLPAHGHGGRLPSGGRLVRTAGRQVESGRAYSSTRCAYRANGWGSAAIS